MEQYTQSFTTEYETREELEAAIEKIEDFIPYAHRSIIAMGTEYLSDSYKPLGKITYGGDDINGYMMTFTF